MALEDNIRKIVEQVIIELNNTKPDDIPKAAQRQSNRQFNRFRPWEKLP